MADLTSTNGNPARRLKTRLIYKKRLGAGADKLVLTFLPLLQFRVISVVAENWSLDLEASTIEVATVPAFVFLDVERASVMSRTLFNAVSSRSH